MVNELHQRTICSREFEFDFSVKLLFVRLYISLGRTLDYQNPFPLRIVGLTQRKPYLNYKIKIYISDFDQTTF